MCLSPCVTRDPIFLYSSSACVCPGSRVVRAYMYRVVRMHIHPHAHMTSHASIVSACAMCACAHCACVCVWSVECASASDRPGWSCVHAAAGRCSLHVVRCTPRHWRRITGTGLWGHCSLPRCAHHPPARPVGRRASRELQHILVLERLRKNTNHPRQSRDATVSMAPRSRRCGASRTPPPATPHRRPARQASPGAAHDCAPTSNTLNPTAWGKPAEPVPRGGKPPRGRASARRGEAASAA